MLVCSELSRLFVDVDGVRRTVGVIVVSES